MNRLFEIVLILLEKEKVTMHALAEHFEVSRRTILRDIDKLLVAGIPIISKPGYEGGISISDSYQLDFKMLNAEERESIIHGLKAIDSIRSAPLLPKFIYRLLEDKETISYDQVIDIDLSSWYGPTLVSKIDIVKEAIQNHTKIIFLYYSNKGKTNKKISPIKILFRWNAWYITGICDVANEVRMYKVNRMDTIMLTDQTFTKANINYRYQEYVPRSKYRLVAIFNKEEKYRLVDEYGVNSFEEQEKQLYFEKGFENKEYLISWLLSFGSHVKVVEPLEIKEEIKKHIKKMQLIYECDI